MREVLAELLRQHRVQQRIGGRGFHGAVETATLAERSAHGRLIRTYRYAVLTWCQQTAHAIDPYVVSNLTHLPANPFVAAKDRDLGPLDSLKRALTATRDAATDALPTLAQLTTQHSTPLVESWRQLARASALAEHDINTGPGQRALTVGQALAVVGDIASITQAVIVLDRRYKNIPEWESLRSSTQLGWAALACALDASLGEPDFSIDQGGWQPPVKLIRGPARPGFLGVLQAEHNLAVRLRTTPSALNLRLIVDSQRLLSAALATRVEAVDPRLAEHWQARARTYGLLQRQLRDIGGLLGNGGSATAEGASAVSRLRAIPYESRLPPQVLTGFVTLFGRVDNRMADLLDDIGGSGHYFERGHLPKLANDTTMLVRPVQETFVPVTATTQARLRALSRHRLHNLPPNSASLDPARSRADLQGALVHRPRPGHMGAVTRNAGTYAVTLLPWRTRPAESSSLALKRMSMRLRKLHRASISGTPSATGCCRSSLLE